MRALLTIFIASIWLVNGLFCKLLDYVPRQQEIIARILGNEYAPFLTNMIGLGEVFIAILIILGYHSRQIAILQVFLIALMNLVEISLAPDLLMFGKLNGLLALAFILVILYNEFYLAKKSPGSGYRFNS
jgi:uncharacterized membrane protein YphA (DoxX/SURF4 family)